MGQRSKILDLPAQTRAELDAKLITGGFRGYEQLEAWLEQQGFEVGKSSIHRYGSRLEERLNSLKAATDQAKALVAASPDDEGAMNEAVIRLAQEKIFTLLMEMELDPESADFAKILKAMSPIVRASLATKKYAAEVRAKTASAVEELVHAQGMSEEQADFWRRKFLGIVT